MNDYNSTTGPDGVVTYNLIDPSVSLGDDVLSLLTTFLSIVFCLLSLLFSKRVPGLIWFGSAYLVTTAGFVAGQLM